MTMELAVGALLAAGAVLLGIGAWLVWRWRALGVASTAWPTARGTIKSSRLVPHDADGIDMFVAAVTYEYKVGVRTYTGDRLRFSGYASTREDAQRDVDKYRAGMPVDVRYAPRQPQTSTLEAGAGGVSAAGLALASGGSGLIFLAVAVALFL
jgi:hypothetical protein